MVHIALTILRWKSLNDTDKWFHVNSYTFILMSVYVNIYNLYV